MPHARLQPIVETAWDQRESVSPATRGEVREAVATALDLASTAFVMDTGRVTRCGPSASLRDDPAIHEAYLGTI